MKFDRLKIVAWTACCSALALTAVNVPAAPSAAIASQKHARIVAYWTKARRDAAIPRDLRIDERGYGYLRLPNGALEPYGHTIAALKKPSSPQPMAKPGGDTTAPTITNRDPANGATVSASYTFKAT
jgi:hypothetical protein